MNDILAIVVLCLLSDALLRELPTHFEPEFDYDAHLQYFKERVDPGRTEFQQMQQTFVEKSFANGDVVQGGSPAGVDSYAVYRELHSPEYIFADAFLMFEKIMELGVKDMFYVGESPPPI